ncbi:MAG: tyrosine-type recombinase/integrase [Nibricoccus sp.]
MSLELRRGKSKWWYGKVMANGRKFTKNLGVEVKGRVPPTLTQTGDIVFERSRAKAQAALEKLQVDFKKRSTAEELVQTIHEIRTGARVSSILLDDMGPRWVALPRRRPLSASYIKQTESLSARFVEYVKDSNKTIREMAQVQSAVCRKFLKAEEERGVTAKTYNNTLIFLRAVFHALRKDAGLAENPFEGIPTRDGETVFRKPFSADELTILEKKSRSDAFIYPLIITGMCTAMRRGDCCTLLRESVDLEDGFIRVKTSKTGEYVQIPIFPLLRAVLEPALAEPSPRAPHYVFPKLASHYFINPDHLTDRVRRVMRAAGFLDAKETDTEEVKKSSRGEVRRVRKQGLRKASVRDFHSFRVTWVTLALSAGVPLEIVQKVTGHRTAGIVMKHYFQPGREDFRRTLASKMPVILAGKLAESEPPSLKEISEKLGSMTAEDWTQKRDDLLARLSGGKGGPVKAGNGAGETYEPSVY